MIQINPLKSYIDGGVRAALTTPPSASLVFDLPGKAIWVKGVKLKGTDHTYTFSHDNYITLTNTPDSNESEDIKIGVNTSALKSAIDTTYGVVSTTANGLAPKFTSGNKLAAAAATTYYFLGWAGSTLKWYQAPFRNIRINSETTDCLGVNNTDPLIIGSGNGISVTWDSTNKKIIITNTKPDVNHNTHYTTMLYIGENNDTKANKNIANPYLKLFDDNTRRATFQIKAGSGIAVASDANGNITITNSSPDVNHNTDRTGIKLTTVSGTKKTDSTLILANSTTGLNIQGGTNKFLIGDGTNYIEVPVIPSFTVSNKDATIGTALTTIATIAGVDIKAKIASYSLSNHTHSVRINGSTKTIAASGAVDLGNYLPLSGGTMGGTAWIVWPDSSNWSNNNSGVTFPVIRGGLQWGGLSDWIKLFSEETSSDNLNLVLQFGDDNSNGLSIRNASNVQTSYISAGGVITTGTFKGNLDWSYITNKPATATRWPSWDEIANKPNTFTPNDHNHDGRYVYNYGGTSMDGASINKNALGMTTNSGITEDWWHILQAAWNGEYRWNSLIAFPTLNRNGMYYRSGLDDNTKWGAWVKLLDVNNYSSTLDSRYYTESESDSRFVNVTGDTMSGNLKINATPSHGNPPLQVCYTSSYTATEQTIGLIKFGSPTYDAYLGIAPATKTVFGKVGYFYHIGSAYEYDWMSSGWSKLMALQCSTGDLWIKSSVTAGSFIKSGSSNSYVLLGGGNHKLVSDFATSAQGVGTIISINKSLTPTTSWIDTGIKTDSATFPGGNGSYIVQISIPSSSGTDGWGDLYTGYFSLYTGTNSSTEDEILLHGASHALLKRIYLKTKATANTDGTMHFYIASEKAFSAARTINFKFRKLI